MMGHFSLPYYIKIRSKKGCKQMRSHISGEFIASVDIDDLPFRDFPNNDTGDRALHQICQERTMNRINEVLDEVREKHGLNLVFMPQYINGGLIGP